MEYMWGTGVQECRSTGVQECRRTGVYVKNVNTGVTEYRRTCEEQDYWSTGEVQENMST